MSCHCVFPSPTEECLATFEGATPDTALRVLVEPGMEGYVRLQQMAYCEGMGWYLQKSMVIPGELLRPLVTELRKADCLLPKTHAPRSVDGLDLGSQFVVPPLGGTSF